jgi:transposase
MSEVGSEIQPSYAELQAENAALKTVVLKLEGRIAELEALVVKLEGMLNLNSKTSSKPPSSDPPWVPTNDRKITGKKSGGQLGHKRPSP